ncbi:MAG: HlyD family type I secretion periplasmic adaptor subunit [Phascolarctobacterium sp.]|nr:HlyD family type I secretion periplasmic adaptor subunit [Phascolarctobacterium sp.]
MLKKIEEWMDKLNSDEQEFLPPALEILEKPPSPMGRVLVWTIIGIFFVSLVWACIGEIDEVVVARGKIIPKGYTKTLQAEDKGIVRNILVKNGDRVTEGQILMELDRTMSESDLNAVKKNIAYYELNIDRITSELEGKPLVIPADKNYDEKDRIQQMSLYNSQMTEKNAKMDYFESQVRQKQDAVTIASAALEKNRQLLTIATDRAESSEKLYKENAVGRFQMLEYRAARIELEQNVSMGQAQLSAAQSDVLSAEGAKAQFLAEWNKNLQQEMLGYYKELTMLKEQERKAELKNTLIEIKAPVAGTVHQMDIHTVGAVVREAQGLLSIVPEGTQMEVEAWMENKDVGFVYEGQKVEVKVDAFNFQKFGVLQGEVHSISADAIEDQRGEQRYRVMVQLDAQNLSMDNKKLNVYPGMNVSAEIKTRKKKIIDFFLEPFQTYKSEALRER